MAFQESHALQCWPALCLTTAVETDLDIQEVENLALPNLRTCVVTAPNLNIWINTHIYTKHAHTNSIHLFESCGCT